MRKSYFLKLFLYAFVPMLSTASTVSSSNTPSVSATEDLGQYKTAYDLWEHILTASRVIMAAEVNHDTLTLRNLVPREQAGLEDFIAKYPSDQEIEIAVAKLCDADRLADSLDMHASSENQILSQCEALGGNRETPRVARALASAEAIREELRHTQGLNVAPDDWKRIDAKITALELEYGSDFSYNHVHPVAELRNLIKFKSKPVILKYISVDGASVDLSKLRGKVVLIDFWATWCGSCVGEVPSTVAAYTKFHDQGFEIIGISLDEHKNELLAYTKEHGMTWPQYFDGKLWDNEISKAFGIEAIPNMWLVDKKGMLVTTDGRDDLAGKVEQLLKEP